MAKGIKLIGKSTDALHTYLGRVEENTGLSMIVSQWVKLHITRASKTIERWRPQVGPR